MSNKTMLQSNNDALSANNLELQNLIDLANNLPEASSGVVLPTLSNEGIADDLVIGKELIDSTGDIVTGTNPYEKTATDNIVMAETDLIAQIQTALKGKSGSGSNNLKMCKIDFTLDYPIAKGVECLHSTIENGQITQKVFMLDDLTASFTIENIVPNTILYFLTIDLENATSLTKSDDISILEKNFSNNKLILMIGENDGFVYGE